MLYSMYQAQSDLMAPWRAWADLTNTAFRGLCAENVLFRSIAAGAELLSRAGLIHQRPPFGIESVRIGGEDVPVTEEAAMTTPFATLLHFRKAHSAELPRVLLVAPMAGHFATLLRHTVLTLLPEHDVYITDWANARDVPREAGRFGLDEYIDHTIQFLEFLGPGAHVIGVCQPCAVLLAAVAVMAETNNAAAPASMTLMAGPIDTRVNPTAVNKLATGNPLEWFERNLIDAVPARYPGANRRVYPGFMQLSAFMSMNMGRHMRAHSDLFQHIVKGDDAKADATRDFYDEYFAVLDLPAEFYLETVERIFQQHHLPRGIFKYRGNAIDPAAIRKTALLTVEGEKDDICAVGQTVAAHDLCTSLKPFRKRQHMQPGVGHYGVFSGTRWQREIYPVVQRVITENG
ncbi:MAG TPA: polyhydroxyalkanoate depolymerase [Rhizomicrobium sp.]|nr:polyhydroxyalkanoate depolymerase [Rhizomicrobium sp.]